MSLLKAIIFNQDAGRQGMAQVMHYDEHTDEMQLHSYQDCTPVLQRAKDLRDSSDGYTEDRSMQLVGTIPQTLVLKLMDEGVDVFSAEGLEVVCAHLDSDWKNFKTTDGSLGAAPLRQHFDLGASLSKIKKQS